MSDSNNSYYQITNSLLQTNQTDSTTDASSTESPEYPILIFTQQPESHGFNKRRIVLNDTIKIGRSVARARPSDSNGIFDCKVLSRNHAVIWYDGGKVWLRDTRSSNGTYVNSHLLSKNAEDSNPREIYSGDIIQFGVEVIENNTTHGCIISQTSIYLPDGSELRKPLDPAEASSIGVPISNYYEEQIYQLAQYIQEASHRERTLEKKLCSLSQLIIDTQEASDSSWKVILNQDRLLEKLQMLQEQVELYTTSGFGVDETETNKGDNQQPHQQLEQERLQKRMLQLVEQKFEIEAESKRLLEEVAEEKDQILRRSAELEATLANSEAEVTRIRYELENLTAEHDSVLRNLATVREEGEANRLQRMEELETANRERIELESRCNDLEQQVKHLQDELQQQKIQDDLGVDVAVGSNKDLVSQCTETSDLATIAATEAISESLIQQLKAVEKLVEVGRAMQLGEQGIETAVLDAASRLAGRFIECQREMRRGQDTLRDLKQEVAKIQQLLINTATGDNIDGVESTKTLLTNMELNQVRLMEMFMGGESVSPFETALDVSVQTDNIQLAQHKDKTVCLVSEVLEAPMQTDVNVAEHQNNNDKIVLLSNQLQSKTLDNEKLRMEVLKYQEENNDLVKQIDALKKQGDELKKESKELRQWKQTQNELDSANSKQRENEVAEELRRECNGLREKVAEIESELEQTRADFEQQQQQIQQPIDDVEQRIRAEMVLVQQQLLTRSRRISAFSVLPLIILLAGIMLAILSRIARPWILPQALASVDSS